MRRFHFASLCMLAAALLPACKKQPDAATKPPRAAESTAPTNRVDIPAAVRQNLGITFAKVESRAVTRTLRLPGRFELLPTAVREYRAMSKGRVELLVQQYATVKAGDPLYRLDTPALRDLQRQLAESDAAVRSAQGAVDNMPRLLAAHERHHDEVEAAIALWEARVKQLTELRDAGGGRAEELAAAKASLSEAKVAYAETMEREAELHALKAESAAKLDFAKRTFDLLIAAAAALTGETEDALRQTTANTPRWQTLKTIEVRATAAGTVDSISATHGAWVDESQSVLTVIAPDQLRFRAKGFQSDLGRLSQNQPAQIVPPTGISIANAAPMHGKLHITPQADAETRTVDLLCAPEQVVSWAKSGVAGFLEVTVAGAGEKELAIPLSCVVRDGLQPIIFRRDPQAPDKVIRMEADLGIDDGRWIAVASGVKEGDEIVLEGAYQLMVATSGSIPKGGHFHADGTYHEAHD